MPRERVGARTAGDRVFQRAQRFSDELLVHEEHTFAQVDAAFQRRVLSPRGWVRRATLARLTGEPQVTHRVVAIAERACDDVRDVVHQLLVTSADLAAESIHDELRHVESTLGKRHEGTAQLGHSAARDVHADTVDEQELAYSSAVTAALAALSRSLVDQLRYAQLYRETAEQVELRWFSTVPARLPGLSGRGVWWNVPTALHAAARAAAIQTANVVRVAGMEGMNRAGGST